MLRVHGAVFSTWGDPGCKADVFWLLSAVSCPAVQSLLHFEMFPGSHAINNVYNTIWFRSSWELIFCNVHLAKLFGDSCNCSLFVGFVLKSMVEALTFYGV